MASKADPVSDAAPLHGFGEYLQSRCPYAARTVTAVTLWLGNNLADRKEIRPDLLTCRSLRFMLVASEVVELLFMRLETTFTLNWEDLTG